MKTNRIYNLLGLALALVLSISTAQADKKLLISGDCWQTSLTNGVIHKVIKGMKIYNNGNVTFEGVDCKYPYLSQPLVATGSLNSAEDITGFKVHSLSFDDQLDKVKARYWSRPENITPTYETEIEEDWRPIVVFDNDAKSYHPNVQCIIKMHRI